MLKRTAPWPRSGELIHRSLLPEKFELGGGHSTRWPTDVNMGASRRSNDGAPESYERHAGTPQMSDQRLAFRAVRVKRDIHRVPMIESHPVMRRRLAKRAHRQLVTESLKKIFVDVWRLLDGPWRAALMRSRSLSFLSTFSARA